MLCESDRTPLGQARRGLSRGHRLNPVLPRSLSVCLSVSQSVSQSACPCSLSLSLALSLPPACPPSLLRPSLRPSVPPSLSLRPSPSLYLSLPPSPFSLRPPQTHPQGPHPLSVASLASCRRSSRLESIFAPSASIDIMRCASPPPPPLHRQYMQAVCSGVQPFSSLRACVRACCV